MRKAGQRYFIVVLQLNEKQGDQVIEVTDDADDVIVIGGFRWLYIYILIRKSTSYNKKRTHKYYFS